MMSYLRDAWGWVGGGTTTKGGTNVSGGATGGVGAGGATVAPGSSIANDVLGGMVGGFEQPMNWKGAGFGGVANGEVCGPEGGYGGGHFGVGAGAGYSTFSGPDSKGYNMSGGSAAIGGVAPVGIYGGNDYVSGGASTNLYTGAGGSGYSYDNGKGDSGYGAKGSYVPMGMMDTNVNVDTPFGSYDAHADNMYMNKVSGDMKVGRDGDKYYADGGGSYQMGVEGLRTTTDTPLGTIGSHADKITYGPEATLGGSYNSKTGALEAHGSYQDGINAKNAGVSYQGGPVDAAVNADVAYGNAGKGYANYDPATGTFKTGVTDGHTGGVRVTNADGHVKVGDAVDVNAHVGEFSNDIQFSGYSEVDANHAKVGGSLDGGGWRLNKANVDATIGSGPNAVKANANADSIGSTNSITDAYADLNWDQGKLDAGFDKLSYGGYSASNVNASVDGPYGINAKAHMGYFNQGLTMEGGKATLDENGLNATLKNATYADLAIKDANYDVNLGGAYHADAKLGEFGTNRTIINNAAAGFDREKGMYASAGDADYSSVYLQGVEANQAIGGDIYKSHLGIGEGYYNHFDGKNLYAGVGQDGAKVHAEDAKYRYLGGKDIDAKIDMFGGNLGVGVGAKELSVGGIDAGYLDFKSDLESTSLDARDIGAHGLRSKDIHADANIGAVGAGASAKEMNLMDLQIQQAKLNTSNYGTTGDASVKGANLDVANIKGGHAGLSYDGQELLGATADYRNNMGVDAANADWDLMSGKADASFKNAHMGQQLSNASLNLGGYELGIPDMGYNLNASGGAGVDLSHGAAHANLGLGGTSVNFGGYEMTVPDWVQAGAGIDLSQGALNANIGGENGVGMDLNLAEGNFDLDAFGYRLDVDQGIRDVGGAIADGAGAVADGAAWVYDKLPSLPSMPSFSLPSVSLPSIW